MNIKVKAKLIRIIYDEWHFTNNVYQIKHVFLSGCLEYQNKVKFVLDHFCY
jgi:hypothetical protein